MSSGWALVRREQCDDYWGSYFSSIPAASPTGDRHDDQADDGFLAIRGPEVSLGTPEVDWSGAIA